MSSNRISYSLHECFAAVMAAALVLPAMGAVLYKKRKGDLSYLEYSQQSLASRGVVIRDGTLSTPRLPDVDDAVLAGLLGHRWLSR